jgi:hypothetical protein
MAQFIELRIRISRPDEGRGRCKGSRAWDPRKAFSQYMQQPIYFQRPAPSHLSKNAPSLQGLSHAGVARSRRRRMISAVKPDEPASNFHQRDNAPDSALSWSNDSSAFFGAAQLDQRCGLR